MRQGTRIYVMSWKITSKTAKSPRTSIAGRIPNKYWGIGFTNIFVINTDKDAFSVMLILGNV